MVGRFIICGTAVLLCFSLTTHSQTEDNRVRAIDEHRRGTFYTGFFDFGDRYLNLEEGVAVTGDVRNVGVSITYLFGDRAFKYGPYAAVVDKTTDLLDLTYSGVVFHVGGEMSYGISPNLDAYGQLYHLSGDLEDKVFETSIDYGKLGNTIGLRYYAINDKSKDVKYMVDLYRRIYSGDTTLIGVLESGTETFDSIESSLGIGFSGQFNL